MSFYAAQKIPFSVVHFNFFCTSLYQEDQIELIQQFIKNNEWMEEESNDLINIISKI